MKKLLLIACSAFIAAGLLSLTNKPKTENVLSTESYIACYATDSRNDIQQDALKPGFAALHPNPTPFILQDAKGETIQFEAADGQMASGYYIKSKKKSNKWLFVVQEWWGLNDNIKREADAFAGELDNVNVLAIDMYDGKVATTRDSAMKYMSGAKTERLATIVNAAIAFAGKKANIYTVGWCFGGAWSLQASLLAGKQAKGCVMYYGRPENKMEKLSTLQCDVIGFFGIQDKGIPISLVEEFEKNLATLGKKITLHKYDAAHGFANPSNPAFNKVATDDAHAKTMVFLKERM